jgi:hypothetical protein
MTETVIPELYTFNTKYHNSSQNTSLFTKIPPQSTDHNSSQIHHIVYYNITET